MTHIMRIDEMARRNRSRIKKSMVNKYMRMPGMEQNVQEWYASKYPNDYQLDLVPYMTFAELFKQFVVGYNDVFADVDSIVRERIFEKLEKLCNLDYNDFYYYWLDNDLHR